MPEAAHRCSVAQGEPLEHDISYVPLPAASTAAPAWALIRTERQRRDWRFGQKQEVVSSRIGPVTIDR
jgi:hypothetical protein